MTVSTPVSLHRVAAAERVDPGRSGVFWWLGLPLIAAIALIMIARGNPQFYRDWILPEAYGVLEVMHVVLPAIGFLIGLSILQIATVKVWTLLWWAVVMFTVTCLFIAGEECSWGQWIFYWETPEYWGRLNRQNETNLHNTSYFLNHFLRNLLKIAVIVGGIVLPLLPMRLRGPFASVPILRILVPPAAIVPAAVATVGFDALAALSKDGGVYVFVPRPSEAVELFMYMFILFYMIMLRRRAQAL